MRLSPCHACARHVRVTDGHCRFCGAGLTTSAPGWLSIALLGLTLAGCDAKPDAVKSDDAKAKTEVQPEPKPEPKPEPEPEPAGTTSTTGVAAEGTTSTTGVDDGASTLGEADAGGEPEADPPPKPKYGAPRIPEDPRPAKKYGAPPRP